VLARGAGRQVVLVALGAVQRVVLDFVLPGAVLTSVRGVGPGVVLELGVNRGDFQAPVQFPVQVWRRRWGVRNVASKCQQPPAPATSFRLKTAVRPSGR